MDYSALLRRSWELTKKNKWLWVYGLVLAAFGGGGGSSGGGGNSGNRQQGEATTALRDWAGSVSLQQWILFGVGMLLLILLAMIISIVIQNWAKGSLIAGLEEADSGGTPTLRGTSPKGIASLKHMILFSIISFLVALGLVIGLILAAAILVGGGYILFEFSKPIQILWLVLGITASVLTGVILLLVLFMIGVYADRLIVLAHKSPWEAWKQGFLMARKKFFPTMTMGMVNSLAGCSAGCLSTIVMLIVLGIPAILLIIPLFQGGNFHWPTPVQAGAILSLFFMFLYLQLAMRAILVVFSYGTWNLFFKEVMKGEKV